MKKYRILIIFVAAIITYSVNAQNETDALRYSTISFGGTARYMSMGGAFGAVGADFSTISMNPAGLGVYRKSEFTFTPSVYNGSTTSKYDGKSNDDQTYNVNVSNAGIVIACKSRRNVEKSIWKSVNLAFGVNRYDNFNNGINAQITNSPTSLMNVYVANANSQGSIDNLDQFSTQLAYNTGLIDTSHGSSNFISNMNIPKGGLLQTKSVEMGGAMQEMVFALGANYNNKLYIGGTIGVPYIRYTQNSTYTEADNNDSLQNVKNFTLNENLTTTGTGINFKLGLIYVPLDLDIFKIKIGAAVHSPTFFSMHDEWSSTMSSEFANGTSYSAESPQGSYDYTLITPMRAIGSLAFQIAQFITVDADYEFVDYSQAYLNSNDYKFFTENNTIQSEFTTANNLRFGAEIALGHFSIRGGYTMYGNPIKTGTSILGINNNGTYASYSGGFGIIDKNYFLDFAYVYNQSSSQNYYLYSGDNICSNGTIIKKTTQNFLMTLGFKF